jgi:putative FmdB family regulatory protein
VPLYEYKCPACGHQVEELRPVVRRDDPADCVKCGHQVARQVSAGSFELKGGGWAKDGYSG